MTVKPKKKPLTYEEYVRQANWGRKLPADLKKQSDEAVAYANANETILSLLYDLNLLPEQLKEGSYRWSQMINVISHFKAAIEAKT